MLCLEQVSKGFKQKQVLNKLSFTVPSSGIHGFIGANGAGKTTTFKLILGLLPIEEGAIYVAGERVVYGQTNRSQTVGYLPDVPSFYPYMTATTYLKLCAAIAQVPRQQQEDLCERLLQQVGLAQVGQQKIRSYSRGMKQRLGIAQALINRPKLLLCDEPTSALDPQGRKEVHELLISLKEEMTIVMSTHLLSDAEQVCDSIIMLNDGAITLSDRLSTIYERYQTQAIVLTFANTTNAKDCAEALEASDWCEVTQQSEQVHLNVATIASGYHRVIAWLQGHPHFMPSLTIVTPTLEEIFMEVVQ